MVLRSRTTLCQCTAWCSPTGEYHATRLLILLSAWGECPDPNIDACPADLNEDDVVNVFDLLLLLGN